MNSLSTFYPARPKGWGRVYISKILSVCVFVCLSPLKEKEKEEEDW
jgi:hypothetical protein